MPTPRILATGFSAFPGARRNPTEVLIGGLDVRRLARRFDIDLAATILPTEYQAVEDILPQLWTAVRPDAVIHFGLHGRAGQVRIEQRGANYIRTTPDAAGRRSGRIAVRPGGPLFHNATLPVTRTVAALRRDGIAATASSDAGGYLCNYALYRSLELAPPGAIAGFVHVPWPAEEHAPRAPVRRPAWADLMRAVENTLRTATMAVRTG